MPRLTGTVTVEGALADGAYVQLQNPGGDFQGEVRTTAGGKYTLHPVAGRWRLVSWLPGNGRVEQEMEVGSEDLEVNLALT